MKTLPLGTAYTSCTGIGAVGAFAVGIIALGESVNTARHGGGADRLGSDSDEGIVAILSRWGT